MSSLCQWNAFFGTKYVAKTTHTHKLHKCFLREAMALLMLTCLCKTRPQWCLLGSVKLDDPDSD